MSALFVSVLVAVGFVVSGASASASGYSYDRTQQLLPRTDVKLVNALATIVDGSRLPARSHGRPRPPSGFVIAAEGALPELSASRSALEAKFKHAADFGVTEGRGAAGFDAYGKAIDSFVGDSSTTRILGTYRGDPAILNYNVNTAQVVVQGTDGTFISGWQMSPAQLQNVIERGSLGGG
jgi:hypothetical protein